MRQIKIESLEYGIQKAEEMIAESNMNADKLTFLRRKIAEKKQDIEVLYLLTNFIKVIAIEYFNRFYQIYYIYNKFF